MKNIAAFFVGLFALILILVSVLLLLPMLVTFIIVNLIDYFWIIMDFYIYVFDFGG